MRIEPSRPLRSAATASALILAASLTVLSSAGATEESPDGRKLYDAHCASCHGANLKGIAEKHTPDLTDDKWLFTGDDLDDFVMHPSDVELTIRAGIRADHPETRNLAVMPPRGSAKDLTDSEVDQVTDYVMHLAGNAVDPAKVAAGKAVYSGKGVCFDCHGEDGKGDGSIGSSDLTRPATWVYGADRPSVHESILKGRAGISPAYEGRLTPAEIGAIARYVFSAAAGDKF